MTADERTGEAHMAESISIAKRSIPCRSQGLLTCSLAHWLNRRSPGAIRNPSAKSIEEATGIKKQKNPRRVPVQVRLQEAESSETKSKTEQKDWRRHDLDRGGMGYMLAQRDASKSDRDGLEELEERREWQVYASRRRGTESTYNADRTRSERGVRSSGTQQRGYLRTVRGGSRMSGRAPGELPVLRVRGQGEGKHACTTSAKIVREG
ncbi:hypothetical protein B0H13DRAFT_1879593 [Mycena leptocephala]|nr:hypothetical protein B0H13DRAFT_1879593 [Mycena leptocephala]